VTPLTAGIGIQTSLAWPIFLGKRTRPHSGRGQARLRGRRTTLTTSNVFDYALARHHNDRWRRRHRTWAGQPSSSLVSHTKAVIRRRDPALCYLVKVATVWGRIMKMMTREQLFAAPKLVRRAKGRFDRGMEAVSAARARATEIAQQCAALPKLIPTASHRRRLARLRASVS
jgi:hypothetical protein